MNEQELRLHRCCFTGHRPEKLKRMEEEVKKSLEKAILKAIDDGYTTFITGMARGVDIWAGQIVLKLRQTNPELRLIDALPYPGCDSRWSASWRKQHADVLEAADLIQSISPQYSMVSFQKRDEWMVDHVARVIAYTMACRVERRTPLSMQTNVELRLYMHEEWPISFEFFS